MQYIYRCILVKLLAVCRFGTPLTLSSIVTSQWFTPDFIAREHNCSHRKAQSLHGIRNLPYFTCLIP